MKRVFGIFEAVFDILYLAAAAAIGAILLCSAGGRPLRIAAGVMALILAAGDTFHLTPRVQLIFTHDEPRLRPALGHGKQIASITMTVFYLLLWHIGLRLYLPQGSTFATGIIYLLAAVRIVLCLPGQNGWAEHSPSVKWGILRNIPFFMMGLLVAGLFYFNRAAVPAFGWMWLAILLSFAFYLPVVLFVGRSPKVGMLMLPKTCAYLWMLTMCLAL